MEKGRGPGLVPSPSVVVVRLVVVVLLVLVVGVDVVPVDVREDVLGESTSGMGRPPHPGDGGRSHGASRCSTAPGGLLRGPRDKRAWTVRKRHRRQAL